MQFDATGDLGVSEVQRLVLELGCIFRRQFEGDVGIDGQIEIVDSGIVTGKLIGVQIKSGSSYFREEGDTLITFRTNEAHAQYWLNYALPVLIALHHPARKIVYWQHAMADTVISTGKGFKIDIPKANQLGIDALGRLAEIANAPRRDHMLSGNQVANPGFASQVLVTFNPGFVSFRGRNLTNITRLETTAGYAEILQATDTMIDARLPVDFNGSVRLYAGEELIDERWCDLRQPSSNYPGIYEIVAADIPLYLNSAATTFRSDFLGLLIRIFQTGESYEQLWPVRPGRYLRGRFLGPFRHDMTAGVGESWYRDPASEELRLGWNGAATLVSEMLPPDIPKLGTVYSLPENPLLSVSEIVTLSARGVETLGDSRREIDLSAEATWESSNSSVAHVDNRILKALSVGSTELRCTARTIQRLQRVQVLDRCPSGERTTFAGLRRTSQIAFDADDNLYVCNQSRFVYRLLKHGGIECVMELPDTGFHHNRIDCIAVNKRGDLFASNLEPTRRIAHSSRTGSSFSAPTLISRW
jgi:hypothetical protein